MKENVGAGDIVKKVAASLGFQPTPGCKCAKRLKKYNNALSFGPERKKDPELAKMFSIAKNLDRPKPGSWAGDFKPPKAPEGWTQVAECKDAMVFTDGQSHIVWSIVNGQYARAHTDCCSPVRAMAEYEKRCS